MMHLDIVAAHSGKYTASNIADMLNVARPSVTQRIKELARVGCITKKQSETHKRVYYLHISDNEVNDSLHQAYKKAESNIYEAVKEQYTSQQIKVFCDMLRTITQTYLNKITKVKKADS